MSLLNFAIIIPMANEAKEFGEFTNELAKSLSSIGSGTVYFVVDNASRDNTLALCRQLSSADARFNTVFEPKNKNVVDAYLRGYKEAYDHGHTFIIEMDAGMSHDPKALPLFLKALEDGNDCAFGSRFIEGGSMDDSSFKRKFLSSFGTFLSNVLLGSKLKDMTSGYQGFKRDVVKQILDYGLLSKAHFYQTEVRYLLRKKKCIEIPIHYRVPSPSVSKNAIYNSLSVLTFYFLKRLSFQAKTIS